MNPILIIGAGPSESCVDYANLPENLDTFGMNLMYRFYPKLHWEPTYFGCFDRRVNGCHIQAYEAMMLSPDCRIKRFFMLDCWANKRNVTIVHLHGKVGDFSMDFETFGYGGCTGVNCAQVAAILGYKTILLVGIDGYKQEIVDGTVTEGRYLKVETPPKTNPNYSRVDYQQPGDVYNLPNGEKFHRPAWKAFARFALKNNIEVVNCSWGEVANFYPRSTLIDEVEAMKK